ncbi:unnamed protein product [Paramecium sonneborni]|uniref:Uncharacterized protein n=1 Tax=Paramecium sonneborni TaxID=65129 RepID=A0A8S1PRE4_9CILI|nr:unnamed protein product [Paramecium sonneborni]
MFVQSSISQGEIINEKSDIIRLKIQNEIEEASNFYQITKVESNFGNTFKQQEYLCRLCDNIELQILFNYDYPRSTPKYFVQQKFKKNPLIDEQTWQIQIIHENSLLNTLNEIFSQFQKYPPQPDEWIQQQVQDTHQDFPDQLIILNEQEMNILKRIPNAQQDENSLLDLILSIQKFQDLYQLITIRATNNQIIHEKVKENQNDIRKLKNDLQNIYNQFQQTQLDVQILISQCNNIQNKFSNQELLRLLQSKKEKLEQIGQQFYSKPQSANFEDQELLYKQFLNNRTEYHRYESIEIVLTQDINQQKSQII